MSTPWSVGRFDGSETFQLRCLFPEDLLIHFRTPFLGGSPAVLDFWIMRGGEPLVMTASEADFPPGFELHPTEARNKFAYRMLERIRAGWKPGEVMTAPNIWRVQGGDRLVLMGRRSMSKSGAFFGL